MKWLVYKPLTIGTSTCVAIDVFDNIIIWASRSPFTHFTSFLEKNQDKVNRKELKRKGKHIPCSLVLTQNESTADQSWLERNRYCITSSSTIDSRKRSISDVLFECVHYSSWNTKKITHYEYIHKYIINAASWFKCFFFFWFGLLFYLLS